MKVIKLLFVAPLGILGACAPAVASGTVAVSAPAYVSSPGLAYVAPGVEVVADWGAPVFFADNFFWYWDGGLWYRSGALGGERIAVREVPVAVARIRNPGGYAHFRAEARAIRPVPAARMQGPRMALRHR
jgi:hypothetical protein